MVKLRCQSPTAESATESYNTELMHKENATETRRTTLESLETEICLLPSSCKKRRPSELIGPVVPKES